MSLEHPPTAAELRATLAILLANPRRAKVPTDTGFDDATLAAVQAVWTAGADPASAQAALDVQLATMIQGS